MKIIKVVILGLTIVFLTACNQSRMSGASAPVIGQLKVGFDVDDTILFSRDNFLKAPHLSDDPDHLDYGWVNQHDSLFSVTIQPMANLIEFLKAHGHEVYFITARPGINGDAVARHLTRELGFEVVKDVNLFFAPKRKDPVSGKKFTTKHEIITALGLHIFYGDADNDMVAASIAGIRGVRVVRDARSVEAYSRNYFGDTKSEPKASAPYTEENYQEFLNRGVGPFGETIYPLYIVPSDSLSD